MSNVVTAGGPSVFPAARVVGDTGKYDRGLKTVLHDELHWLNVPERIEFKLGHLGVMVYRCLHDRAPRYLADHLIPASDAAPRRLRLRSANPNRLTVPRCRLARTAVGLFITLARQSVIRCQIKLDIRTDLIILNDSRKQFYSAVTSVTSAVEV